MHKYYIDKIVNSRDSEKINKLKDIIIDTISYMKTLDEEEYENIECDLYEISEGKVLNEEKAKHIIENMKPYGMHWTLDQTESVRKANGFTTIRPIDFWIVMNSAYNDLYDWFDKIFKTEDEKITNYAMYAKKWILDKDAKETKVYDYFTTIPEK